VLLTKGLSLAFAYCNLHCCALDYRYHGFGVFGTIFRELEWETPIFF
jgi:hypothetical protein